MRKKKKKKNGRTHKILIIPNGSFKYQTIILFEVNTIMDGLININTKYVLAIDIKCPLLSRLRYNPMYGAIRQPTIWLI